MENSPKMADKTCSIDIVPNVASIPGFQSSASCVGINQCPGVVDISTAPLTSIMTCGFDEAESQMMVCCPDEMVQSPKAVVQDPRFPKRNGNARNCEDKSRKMCRNWKQAGGCALDIDLSISKLNPDNHIVKSFILFDLMQITCPETCGWCGDKGCRDEHPRCQEWTRAGMCATKPFFMAHTCRESCGVCGFLSPTNTEEQVIGDFSYTDLTASNFDCGRFKRLAISVEEEEIKATDIIQIRKDEEEENKAEEPKFFRSSDGDGNGGIFCGATVVADRWMVTAAHCYDETRVQFGSDGEKAQIIVNTIRDGTEYSERIEIKRIYIHPDYHNPISYNDVAVLELGRRIEYDFDKFGDTPVCIDKGLEKESKIATLQGYGETEDGVTSRAPLVANLTILSNQECQERLRNNITTNQEVQQDITKALPLGVGPGLICGQGVFQLDAPVKATPFTDACKGDSGGPIHQDSPDGRSTIIGIVSAGVGCGEGYPGWYTRVESYTDWVQCIIDQSVRFKNVFAKVEELCSRKIDLQSVDCEEVVADPDVALFDLREVGLSAEEACAEYLGAFST